MDYIDLQILKILREDVRTPIKNISAKVSISPAAVSKRISDMRGANIIRPSFVLVNAAALGYNMRCYFDIRIPRENLAKFEEFITKADNVIEANYITGEYTAFVKGAFRNVDELSQFVAKLREFGDTYTRVGLDRIVVSKGLPIPDDIPSLNHSDTESM